MSATSPRSTGVPVSLVLTTTFSRSSVDFTYPLPRTMYSVPAHSMSRPPTSLLLFWIAFMTSMRESL